MKCAEVMEWMHRYIDQDLSRNEIIEMFRHIDDCPSCAEVFDQLTFLSKQLEELPDVKAPFSLVDSILPQLDELDRAARDQGATRAEEQVVVPFSSKSTASKSSKGSSILTRTGIGAVAAAVLLGVAILNMPDKMPGAEVEQSLMSNATALSDEDMDMASKSQATDTTNGSDELSTADVGIDMGVSQEAATGETNEDSSSADTVVPSDSPVAPKESPLASSEPNPASVGRSVSAPTDSLEPKRTEKVTPPKQSQEAKMSDANSRKGSSDASKLDKKDVAVNQNNVADVAPSSEMESSIQVPYVYVQGVMSLRSSEDEAVQTWTSPDGLYAAELAGQQLIIFSISPDGSIEDRLAVTSYPLEGDWVSGEWSPDSLKFTYTTEQDGITTTKVYDIQAKASFAPSPAASPVVTPGVTPTTPPTN